MTHPDVSHQLRLAGLRVTRPRESVLEWLAGHPHTTADQIRAGIVQRLGSVSTPDDDDEKYSIHHEEARQ
ncbi:MAG: hypothetical protein ACT4NY_23905 [Pseudonocardiales bacterium]